MQASAQQKWEMWRPAAEGAPYFRIRRISSATITEGAPSCTVGHLNRLAGDPDPFVAWKWDGRQLEVWNDRYGFQPLFYSTGDGEEIIVSPSLCKLLELGVRPDLDYEALAVFLRIGFFIGDDTPFSCIRLLPPNARLSWTDGQLRIESSYCVRKAQPITWDDAIDGYIELFRQAMRRRPAEGRCSVPLSGGRDSRHIFLELCESSSRPDNVISIQLTPEWLSEDVRVAQLLAEEAGVLHVIRDAPLDLVAREGRKNIETHLSTTEHGWIPITADDIGSSLDTLYEGVAGDTLSTAWSNGEQRQTWYEEGKLEPLADSLLDSENYLPRILPARQYELMSREVAREKVRRELERHTNAGNPLGSFFFWNRTRRVTGLAPTCLWYCSRLVWCPYLDSDLFDFLSSIPARVLLSDYYHQFHTDTILRAYPRFAHIPFARKGTIRRGAPSFERSTVRDLMRFAISAGDSFLMRSSYAFPRLLRGLVNRQRGREIPDLAKVCVYLLQLGACANGKAVPSP